MKNYCYNLFQTEKRIVIVGELFLLLLLLFLVYIYVDLVFSYTKSKHVFINHQKILNHVYFTVDLTMEIFAAHFFEYITKRFFFESLSMYD